MEEKSWFMKNLANIVTAFGFFLTLWLIVVIVYDPNRLWLAFLLFLTAGITDFIDGKIARKLNIVSDVGKLLDRTRDKILVCSIFPLLFWYHWPQTENFFLATTITLALIICITLIEVFLFVAGAIGTVKGWDIASNKFGKIKMFSEFIVITFWFLSLSIDKYTKIETFQYLIYLIDLILAIILYFSIKSLGGYCQRYNIKDNIKEE